MLYRVVPKNGDTLSVLGYGCMRLPMRMQSIHEELAEKQILRAGRDLSLPRHVGLGDGRDPLR